VTGRWGERAIKARGRLDDGLRIRLKSWVPSLRFTILFRPVSRSPRLPVASFLL